MPRLYSIHDDFNEERPNFNPSHFFPTAIWRSSHARACWQFDLDKDFPTQSYIHCSDFGGVPAFWVPFRKAVERGYMGDVFYAYENKNYNWWYNKDAVDINYLRKSQPITHGYWTFYFEELSDQTMFILQNGELLTQKKYRFHPEYGVSCLDGRYDVPDNERIMKYYY
jgi:hypothetical protein